jgi:hypothetical protein
MRNIILQTWLLTMSCAAFSQVTVPGDDPYWTRSRGAVQYIYPREFESHIPMLSRYMDYFNQKYGESFAWVHHEPIKVGLLSSRNQIAKGFATVIPMLETIHFSAGFNLLDQFAESSFLVALASHETAHLYQLAPQTGFSRFITAVFGHSAQVFLGPLPYFPFPNALLPSAIPEGNAVLNESAIQRGGRLWSGVIRAEVMAEYLNDQVNAKWLFNARLDAPFGRAYHQGGYWFGFMAEDMGLPRTNQFFKEHSRREFWPFNLNKSFRKVYGKSYTRLLHDFSRWLEPMAKNHRQATGEVLTRVPFYPHFNSDSERIMFLGHLNNHGPTRLFSFSKEKMTLDEKRADVPSGKPFYLDKRIYSVSSEQINPTEIRYGLFSAGFFPKSDTLNQIVQDIRAGQVLSIDATQSYASGRLLKNGEFLDWSHSSAILDSQGRAYYFRQLEDERALFRDKELLFKYKGYFGILTEVTAEGAVEFIANTPSGASLFRWQNGQFVRLFNADNIADARQVRQDLYLVSAITAKGYEIQKLQADAKPEAPAVWTWKWPTEKLEQFTGDKLEGWTSEETTYGALSEMRYESGTFQFGAGTLAASAKFTDPLWWNELQLAVANSYDGDFGAGMSYEYRRHRLGLKIGAQHVRTPIGATATRLRYTRDRAEFLIGLNYRLFQFGHWSSAVEAGPVVNFQSDRATDLNHYGVLAKWNFDYRQGGSPLNYQPERQFSIDYTHRTEAGEHLRKKVDSVNGGTVFLSFDLFRQTYLDATAAWWRSEQNSIDVDYLDVRRDLSATGLSLFSDGLAVESREWSVTLKQAIDWNYYFVRFPLSVRRFAPYVKLLDIYTKEATLDRLKGWRQQVQYGTEIEFLIFNNYGARAIFAFDTIDVGHHISLGPAFSIGAKASF